MDDTIIIYDVKHTLASGNGKILPRKSKPLNNDPGWVKLPNEHGIAVGIRKIGLDCTINPNVALELAAELRDRKIKNLKRQIARLEAMQFEIVDETNA